MPRAIDREPDPMMILAHGAAGVWDEVAFLLCPLVFLGVLIIAGRRRRPGAPDPDASPPDAPEVRDAPDASAPEVRDR